MNFIQPPSQRNQSIDGLRGLAVLLVFHVHFFAQHQGKQYFAGDRPLLFDLFRTLHSGIIGVDIFFVISGFLIWRILFHEQRPYVTYFVDRVNRLMPTYLLNILIVALSTFSLVKFLENVFFLPQLVPGHSYYNYVAWTLGWEWIFYILLFLVCIATNRNRKWSLIMLGGLFIVNYILSYVIKPTFIVFPDAFRFAGFFVGCFLSEWSPKLKGRVFYFLGYASLPMIFSACVLWGLHADQINSHFLKLGGYYVFVDLAAFLLINFLLNFHSIYQKLFSFTPLRILGLISYTFYLTHSLIGIPIANQIFNDVHGIRTMALSYCISLLTTALISYFLYTLTEKNYCRHKAKFLVPGRL